jgi:hypothetical protein
MKTATITYTGGRTLPSFGAQIGGYTRLGGH